MPSASESGNLTSAGESFLEQLLSIEVNTIIAPGMTARMMPPIPLAILEIAAKYYWFLIGLCRKINDTSGIAGLQPLAPETRTNGIATFDRLRKVAEDLLNNDVFMDFVADSANGSALPIVQRVYRTSSAMTTLIEKITEADEASKACFDANRATLSQPEMVRAASQVRLEPDDIAFVRKAWEVGADEIAVQTVVQLSGDSVTRIATAQANIDMKAIHEVHLRNVRNGVETWTTMARLAAEIVTGALDSLGRFFGLRTT